ncbi:hypothetical protein A2Z33_04885 [Candidatus Gottesmanbacteria bacterium RBG_16_52_11]|uniref:Cell division protein FtsL n=1 Tax=Candidatus Gottesmanbacteria bacterium RBG_16_52_11 TaxID=1798374 RepID=A0A1F5YU96_9BACT|nr:MAG: hypothetical protein A2Z33_04885 [Candidatus Gottesmanbacteria bacterium RBG_16_52_11]
MSRIYRFFQSTLIVITILLLGLQFLLSNGLVTAGDELAETDKHISALQEENELLKQQLAVASSLAALGRKAEELGFIPNPNYMTVETDQPVAIR